MTIGHLLLPTARAWPLVHALLPAFVYSFGLWSAGRRPTWALALRGLLVVAAVAGSLTAVHAWLPLPLWARTSASYLVPLLVTLAAARPARVRA